MSGARRRRRDPGWWRRPLQRRGARQGAVRQGGRRPTVHHRSRQGMGGGSDAAGSRDDVPADLPAVHAAARRSDGVRRDEVAGAGTAGEPDARARTWSSSRRSTPRSAADIPRRQPETPETVAQWNLERSLAFYKARFADASNFTFVFVGSFTPETHQAAGRDLHRQPAGDARATRPGATSASPRRAASSRRRSRRASRRRVKCRSSSPARSSTTTRTRWRCRR